MLQKRIILTLFALLIFLIIIHAQDRQLFIEPKFHYGTLVKHSPKIIPLIKGKISIMEINLSIPTIGRHKWNQLYRYPELGVGYIQTWFHNPEMIGNSYTLNFYIRIPIIKTRIFKLYYHIGTGPTYFPVIYDPVTNPLNKSISSHINLYIHVGLEGWLRVYKYIMLTGGYGINHYSFGNLVQPNVGLNVFSPYIGLNCALIQKPIEYIHHEIDRKEKHHEVWMFYAAGYKESHLKFGKKYFTSTASVNYARQFNVKHKIGFGIDGFYDQSLKLQLKDENYPDIQFKDLLRGGINVSHELLFMRFSFLTQFGRYFYSKTKAFGRNYYRVGFKYYMKNNLFLHASLKAHLPAIADFVEFGVGYRFIK